MLRVEERAKAKAIAAEEQLLAGPGPLRVDCLRVTAVLVTPDRGQKVMGQAFDLPAVTPPRHPDVCFLGLEWAHHDTLLICEGRSIGEPGSSRQGAPPI